jgi:casein kinase 1
MNPKDPKKEKDNPPEENKDTKDLVFNNGVYAAKKKISAGSFGTVYTGVDTTNNEEVALKLEKIEEEEMRSLQRESQILSRLQGIKGIPKLYWYGNKGIYDVIVITLLGRDLGSFLKIYKKFSLKTVLMIGDQLLTVLQDIHTKSVVHRDIKPENIIMGRGDNKNIVYLVDYGISKIFRDSQNKHIPYREKKSFIGTTRYASIAAHMGVEVARKDDLESLIYVLIYLAKGQLPWQNLNVSEKEKTKKVGEIKMKYTAEELCKDLPEEFATYLNYVRGLNFKQHPDYEYIRKLFRELATAQNIELDNAWDWTVPLKLKTGSKLIIINLGK